MKPHPSIRKTIKWGGAAVTVLLVVAWIGSGWWYVMKQTHSWRVELASGRIDLVMFSRVGDYITPDEGVFLGGEQRLKYKWTVECGRYGAAMPLWMIVCLAASATALAWRSDWIARGRERSHLCPKCGYDRAGLVAGAVCPECGAGPASV